MADVKVTKMVIKVVNLQCSKCLRKIKKVLCHYPEIRDQMYDEKQNTVMITVVCCNPEHIKQKIACKARDIVVSIEIVPDKPKEPEKKKEPEKPKVEPPKVADKPPPPPIPRPVMGIPWQPLPFTVPMYPVGVCSCCYKGGPCYHGRGTMCHDGCGQPSCKRSGTTCHDGCGQPSCKCSGPMCHDGCERPPCKCSGPTCHDGCGRPSCQCSGGNRDCYVSSCSEYFSEDNAPGCSGM